MLFEAYAVEDSRAVRPPAPMPSVILISRTSGGQTQHQQHPGWRSSFLARRPKRKLQVTSGTKSLTTRNETAAEAVYFSITAGVRGVD
jgi:hypothetical protein